MLPSGVWVYFILLPNEEDSIDSVLLCNPSGRGNSPIGLRGVLNGTVKWYSTLGLTIWFVSACEYAGNGSHYEA